VTEVVLQARLAARHIELDLTEPGALRFTSVEEAVAAEAKTS